MEHYGISIVVLSYERLRALAELLDSLLAQELGGLRIELLLWNNSPNVHLERSPGSELGGLLMRFSDAKIFHSTQNWLCRIRYTLAARARYDTILFIDDDLAPTDRWFVHDMHAAFITLRAVDILSCWTALWTEWNEHSLTKVRMGFRWPDATELTECDYAGPGICMFNKRILSHPAIVNLPPEWWRSDSSWFPWITAMELGSRKYYLPSYGRLRLHEEHAHGALNDAPGFRTALYAAYKQMWKRGYTPVLSRIRSQAADKSSPELRAVKTLPLETDPW